MQFVFNEFQFFILFILLQLGSRLFANLVNPKCVTLLLLNIGHGWLAPSYIVLVQLSDLTSLFYCESVPNHGLNIYDDVLGLFSTMMVIEL